MLKEIKEKIKDMEFNEKNGIITTSYEMYGIEIHYTIIKEDENLFRLNIDLRYRGRDNFQDGYFERFIELDDLCNYIIDETVLESSWLFD